MLLLEGTSRNCADWLDLALKARKDNAEAVMKRCNWRREAKAEIATTLMNYVQKAVMNMCIFRLFSRRELYSVHDNSPKTLEVDAALVWQLHCCLSCIQQPFDVSFPTRYALQKCIS